MSSRFLLGVFIKPCLPGANQLETGLFYCLFNEQEPLKSTVFKNRVNTFLSIFNDYKDTLFVSSCQYLCYNFFMEINEIFSKNLIRLRKLKGLSQRELAKATHLTQRIINYYENNPKSIPADKLKILASALDTKISDFFNEDDSFYLDNIDVRWVKKINNLKQLSEADRKEINRHINSLLEKSKLKKEKELQQTEK